MRKALPACLAVALLALPATAAAQSNAQPPLESKFEQVTLNDRPGEPVSLAVLPDRRVLHTARTGEVRLFDPKTQLNTLAAEVDVYSHDEEGLQGIAVDPNFERQPVGLPLLLAAAGDTPEDDPTTPTFNEGDAPIEGDDPADFGPVQGRAAPVALQVRGRQAGARHRAEDHRRPGRPGHLLPRRRPDRVRSAGQPAPLDRRRLEPVRVARVHPDRRAPEPQPGVRRAAHLRQHERPARQAAAHPPARQRRLRHPAREPVPPRHGEDQARDLR